MFSKPSIAGRVVLTSLGPVAAIPLQHSSLWTQPTISKTSLFLTRGVMDALVIKWSQSSSASSQGAGKSPRSSACARDRGLVAPSTDIKSGARVGLHPVQLHMGMLRLSGVPGCSPEQDCDQCACLYGAPPPRIITVAGRDLTSACERPNPPTPYTRQALQSPGSVAVWSQLGLGHAVVTGR